MDTRRTGQTKMIIITSDEDVIRHCVLNLNKETHIIDMNDDNTSDLNCLSESSKNHNRSKPIKTRKKSTDLICAICGDRAIGYNYTVLSCASCKAFFHRNGPEDVKRFKCLTGHGQCIIDHQITRKCYRCRLERCLAIGMRRDFLLSPQEIQRRKDIGRNRRTSSKDSKPTLPILDEIDRFFMDTNENNDNTIVNTRINFNEMENFMLKPLNLEDLRAINSIQTSFLSIIENKCDQLGETIDRSNRESELICCLQVNNEIALVIIEFCRFIDKFQSLHVDDRFLMIKYNLILLFCILTCYRPKEETDDCSLDREQVEAEEKHQMYVLCNQSPDIYELIINLGITFNVIIEQDRTLVSLLLTIFLFSKGLSMNENEPLLRDSLTVHRAQSYYTTLLWNYLIQKQGETNTCKYFIKLLKGIFRAQFTALKFREFLSSEVTTLDTVDEIAPLMRTILHVS